MVLIRDISVYDADPIDYGSYDGLIIRCFNGSVKDAKYDKHKAGAKAAGKPFWPYMFFNFLYPALPQIHEVLNIIQGDSGNLPLAIDVEQWAGHLFPERSILLANLQSIRDAYYAVMGKSPQFYMNPAAIHYLKPIPAWLLNCPLWIAHWGAGVPDYEPWQYYTFWQYQGEPDYNRYGGTDAQYWAYVGGIPCELPEMVRTTADTLNLRVKPMGVVVGHVPKGTLLGVDGEAYYNGVRWWRVGNAYVSSEWCENVS